MKVFSLLFAVLVLVFVLVSYQHRGSKKNTSKKDFQSDQIFFEKIRKEKQEELDRDITSYKRMERRKSFGDYERIHSNGKQELPWAVEIEKQFPSTDHFITHFGMRSANENLWNSEALFGGRYTLTLQAMIKIDYSKQSFCLVGEPKFYLSEMKVYDRKGNGEYGESFSFGRVEFEKLVASNWDFSSIGILLNPKPIANFDLMEAMVRAPRYPISLVDSPRKDDTKR